VPEGDVSHTIALLTGAAESGDRVAAKALFETLYSELHRMARGELARRGGSVSLSATTLLHEAYLAMASREGPSFPDRSRFMGYASKVMRTFIIDHARERRAEKRGGLFEITSLETTTVFGRVREGRAGARRNRGFKVLLWPLFRGNRRATQCLRTHGAAKLGEGAPLSPPDDSR